MSPGFLISIGFLLILQEQLCFLRITVHRSLRGLRRFSLIFFSPHSKFSTPVCSLSFSVALDFGVVFFAFPYPRFFSAPPRLRGKSWLLLGCTSVQEVTFQVRPGGRGGLRKKARATFLRKA